MRTIAKQGDGGYQLGRSHGNPPVTPQQAESRWKSFRDKDSVLQSLLREQYYLCCYSELRADQAGLGYHIEHVENKSQNPARTFDYSNLATSTFGSPDLSAFKKEDEGQQNEVFGGHASGKRAGVDLARFVSCHQADCQRYFSYLSDGRVVPSIRLDAMETDRAQYTIDLLNLNSPYLITRRRQWWDELDQIYQEHVEKDWSLIDLAAIDLMPVSHRLSPFFSLTCQFFGRVAERLLEAGGQG